MQNQSQCQTRGLQLTCSKNQQSDNRDFFLSQLRGEHASTAASLCLPSRSTQLVALCQIVPECAGEQPWVLRGASNSPAFSLCGSPTFYTVLCSGLPGKASLLNAVFRSQCSFSNGSTLGEQVRIGVSLGSLHICPGQDDYPKPQPLGLGVPHWEWELSVTILVFLHYLSPVT